MTPGPQQTVYYDKTGLPQLVNSYCAFVDLLGFSSEIKDAAQSGKENEVFKLFMKNIEPEIQRIFVPSPADTVKGWPRQWDAKVFTDNIVLGYAIWSGHGECEFGHALTQLMEFQLSVALKGYFVRGGWAVGKLFMNQNIVYGLALINACELESNDAIYPRIILSNEMKEIVFRHMAFHLDPPQCVHLMIDCNGTILTNYLSETIVENFEESYVKWEWLELHAQQVKQRLIEHAGNKEVLQKYQWLASYHNVFCDFVQNNRGYSDKVRIPGEFSDFGIRPLQREDSPYPPSPKQPWL